VSPYIIALVYLHSIQTGSEAHPASFSGDKESGREVDHSLLSRPEVNNMWIYTFSSPFVFMA
jgi:hypothetical protein